VQGLATKMTELIENYDDQLINSENIRQRVESRASASREFDRFVRKLLY
jgi:hypothetical protein